MHTVFVIQPFVAGPDVFANIIEPAVATAGAQVIRADEIVSTGMILEGIFKTIEESDLIIADLTGRNPNVMYELGFAHALKKPVILMLQGQEQTPFDLATVRILRYATGIIGIMMAKSELEKMIAEALSNPGLFSARPKTDKSLNTVFLSYSHKDRYYLDRALVHLRPLERKGLIDVWADTRVEAGNNWKSEIEAALRRARVAVLLVSADFLASDFIVDNELPPLLQQAEGRGTKIIPLILKPCAFKRDKSLAAFQALNDPTDPLSKLTQDAQEVYFDKLSEYVERLFPSAT